MCFLFNVFRGVQLVTSHVSPAPFPVSRRYTDVAVSQSAETEVTKTRPGPRVAQPYSKNVATWLQVNSLQ